MLKQIIKIFKKIPILKILLRRNQDQILRSLPRSLILKLFRPTIDWNKIDTDVDDYLAGDEYGITIEKRNPKIIVSLTSYPARIPRIHYTIISLLRQTIKPDEIILWLGKEQFSNENNDLPNELLNLQNHGLTIKYYKDIKSYKKLIPALKEYPEDIIVTADDDVFYHTTWLEALLDSYEYDKTSIHCHRACRILQTRNGDICNYKNWQQICITNQSNQSSYWHFFIGVGGVLYPPNVLFKDITDEGIFIKLCPMADDIWFWAMAVMNGTKICVVKNNIPKLIQNRPLEYDDIFEPKGLTAINVGQNYNDVQLKQILKHYPQLASRLEIKIT